MREKCKYIKKYHIFEDKNYAYKNKLFIEFNKYINSIKYLSKDFIICINSKFLFKYMDLYQLYMSTKSKKIPESTIYIKKKLNINI
jgi:hypothetical protein